MSRGTKFVAPPSLADISASARELSDNLSKHDDWMSRVNSESLLALSELAAKASDGDTTLHGVRQGQEARLDADDLKAPLLAAVGAADVALERVSGILVALGQRLDETLTGVSAGVDASFANINKLQNVLPSQVGALTEWLSSTEEFRRFAERYAETVQAAFDGLVVRGEATLERLSGAGLEKLPEVSEPPRAPSIGGSGANFVGLEVRKSVRRGAAPLRASKKAACRKAPVKTAAARGVKRK
jgi:heparin binding hemagglutinin HbhA